MTLYLAVGDDIAWATSKAHLSIHNNSARPIEVIALKWLNTQIGAIAAVRARFELARITSHSGGTDITAKKFNTLDDDLDPLITIKTGATLGGYSLFYPFNLLSAENTLTQPLSESFFGQFQNIIFERDVVHGIVLNQGEGLCVKQIDIAVVGKGSWVAIVEVQ